MKYSFTAQKKNETAKSKGQVLYQIVSNENNTLGGYIWGEGALSQDDTCWVEESCCVKDSAQVLQNAKIKSNSIVCGKAIIKGSVIVRDSYIDGAVLDGKYVLYNTCIGKYGRIRKKEDVRTVSPFTTSDETITSYRSVMGITLISYMKKGKPVYTGTLPAIFLLHMFLKYRSYRIYRSYAIAVQNCM